jgi:hypothetical protein
MYGERSKEMFYILITGIIMGIASATFWCIEAMSFVNAMKAIPTHTIGDRLAYPFRFMFASFNLAYLAIDITATIWLSASFGFSGMIGGVIGLTISNVISVFLLIIARSMKDKPKPEYHWEENVMAWNG